MAEVTKEDIRRIHDKLEPIAENVTIIKTKLEIHLKAHEKWGGPAIRLVFDFVKMGIVCIATWLFVKK